MQLGEDGRVADICGRIGGARGPAYLFSGVYVVGADFIRRIPAGQVISVIPVFLDMIRQGARLGGEVLDDGFWMDLGTVAAYEATNAAPPRGKWHGE